MPPPLVLSPHNGAAETNLPASKALKEKEAKIMQENFCLRINVSFIYKHRKSPVTLYTFLKFILYVPWTLLNDKN